MCQRSLSDFRNNNDNVKELCPKMKAMGLNENFFIMRRNCKYFSRCISAEVLVFLTIGRPFFRVIFTFVGAMWALKVPPGEFIHSVCLCMYVWVMCTSCCCLLLIVFVWISSHFFLMFEVERWAWRKDGRKSEAISRVSFSVNPAAATVAVFFSRNFSI